MSNIIIKYNSGFSWYEANNISAVGYAYSGNEYLDSEGIVNYILQKKISSFNEFKAPLTELSGSFSIIFKNETETFLYSDISRIFPVFYRKENNGFKVSDSPDLISSRKISTGAINELLKFGYTLFDNTIWEDTKQVEPGQAVYLSSNEIRKEQVFRYDVKRYRKVNKALLRKEMSDVFMKVGKKYTESLKGRQVILPLSGGLDSRYIAAFLKHNNYTNVVCFNYGNEYNREAQVSEHIAKTLGFEWHFIKNTDSESLNPDDKEFQEYYKYGARGVSFFHMHEYLSIKKLKKDKLADENAIVFSGIAGDLLAGSQLIKTISPVANMRSVAKSIFNIKYQGINNSDYSFNDFKNSHKTFFESFPKLAKPLSVFDHWFMQEKVPKTNFNAGFLYLFNGFESRFPFWDSELIELFRNTPAKYRINEKLYYEVLKKTLFEPYGIAFDDDLKNLMIKNIKQAIKRTFFKFLKPYKYNPANNNLLSPLIKQMQDENLKFTYDVNSEDGFYLQWYLHKEIKNAENKDEALFHFQNIISKIS